MTGRDLGAKVSSLFDVVALHRPLKNAGSSVISYACDPRHDEDVGLHRAKKVFFVSDFELWRDRVTKYLIFHMENMHNFEKKSIAFHWQILVIKIYQKKNNNNTLTWLIFGVCLKVYYENTYQLDPPSKFRADKVRPIIEQVLQVNLEGRREWFPRLSVFNNSPLNINIPASII